MHKLAILALLVLVPSVSFAASFDTNLRYGSSGSSVLELQEFLTTQGVYHSPITGNFFSLTLAGVKAFQVKENVMPVSGFFGPLTRAAAVKELSVALSVSDQEASNTPVVNTPNQIVPNPLPAPVVNNTPPANNNFGDTQPPVVQQPVTPVPAVVAPAPVVDNTPFYFNDFDVNGSTANHQVRLLITSNKELDISKTTFTNNVSLGAVIGTGVDIQKFGPNQVSQKAYSYVYYLNGIDIAPEVTVTLVDVTGLHTYGKRFVQDQNGNFQVLQNFPGN